MKLQFLLFAISLVLASCNNDHQKRLVEDPILQKAESYGFTKSYNACVGAKGKEYQDCIKSLPTLSSVETKKYYDALIKNKFIIGSELSLKKNFDCENEKTVSFQCPKCHDTYSISIAERRDEKHGIIYDIMLKNSEAKVVSFIGLISADEGNCFLFLDLDGDNIPEIISLSSAYWANTNNYYFDIYSIKMPSH
ncbi:hypothetical protein [Soonwooa sp.]|uniref:hypothetical protein n=1 Tax=Soonwooa sp. TaxID=1938592 RepID=UPI002638928C|nr:hypothetical protein [Soonwooa sp.]